jgi:tetratricopeptide (TPR) repeat protein
LGKGKSNLQKRRGSIAVRQAPLSGPRAKAYALRDAGRYPEAFEAFKPLYESTPQDITLGLDFGHICMEVEHFDIATRVFAKILDAEPKNIVALSNLGGSLIRVGRLQDARAILEYVLELDPKNLHARINLGGVLQAAGEREANLHNALEAIAIEPTATLAFNNLGAAFSDMAMFSEAKHAYETAVMLDPKNIDALINLAASESRLGNSSESAKMYERVLQMLPKEATNRADAIRFYAAFEYLKQGVLEKGWDYYEGGFSPLVPATGARAPRREFRAQRWNGAQLHGKTLMVWREQGLGDELLFATCLHELEALGGQIIVECDKRLVETFARSFPKYRVRAEQLNSPIEDFDLHVPIGSLMKYFRRNIKDFEGSGAYIKVDPAKVKKFEERLAPYGQDYRLVGICWRSGKLDPVRNLNYTKLDDLSVILKDPNLKFVNLQYGECEAEIRAVEEEYGIEILRWADLNLKDDLDDVFALIECLHSIISVQTAVLVAAGAVGKRAFGLKCFGWTRLGSENQVWFENQVLRHEGVTQALQIYRDEIVFRDAWESLWPVGNFTKLLAYFRANQRNQHELSPDWLSHYSMLLARLGDINQAIEICARLEQSCPDLHDIYWRVGWHYYVTRGEGGALDLFYLDKNRGRVTDFGYAKFFFLLAKYSDEALAVEVQELASESDERVFRVLSLLDEMGHFDAKTLVNRIMRSLNG